MAINDLKDLHSRLVPSIVSSVKIDWVGHIELKTSPNEIKVLSEWCETYIPMNIGYTISPYE